MSWEIESEVVDKAEGLHRFILIERSVINRDGQQHRYEFTIRLGMGSDGESCAHCGQPVQRDVTLAEDGSLVHATRGPVSPHDLAREKIAELNAFHSRMDAYTRKHKATLYKGPGK
jgi:hypothetical protein